MKGLATAARRVANVVNLSTPLGLAVAGVGRCRISPGQRGLWYAEGYSLPFPVAGAFTVGNVIITPGTVAGMGPGALAHEERHAWQYMACGTFFLPLYLVAMGWSWLRTGDRAARNVFERMAGLADGGYRDVPVRPLRRQGRTVRP
ncbi:MAG TPA: hypothetical protein VFK68_09355 [Propionibacteriaceae bacterium]|nr:hypothetical protein [Propionibacteriaceae bacterium]